MDLDMMLEAQWAKNIRLKIASSIPTCEPRIYYHGPMCADGFTAAYVAWKAHPQAIATPVLHNEPPPDVTDQHVILLDFAYPRQNLLEMLSKAKSLTVLDHHATSSRDLEYLEDFCLIDLGRCGAQLASDFFFPGQPYSTLVKYIADRDLWKWELPFSAEISATIDSYAKNIDNWRWLEERLENNFDAVAAEGVAIRRYQKQIIEKSKQHAEIVRYKDYTVALVNATTLNSDIGNYLCKELGVDFTAVWSYSQGKYHYSLRADKDRNLGPRPPLGSDGPIIDLSKIAEELGGGGHPSAAGVHTEKMPWEIFDYGQECRSVLGWSRGGES